MKHEMPSFRRFRRNCAAARPWQAWVGAQVSTLRSTVGSAPGSSAWSSHDPSSRRSITADYRSPARPPVEQARSSSARSGAVPLPTTALPADARRPTLVRGRAPGDRPVTTSTVGRLAAVARGRWHRPRGPPCGPVYEERGNPLISVMSERHSPMRWLSGYWFVVAWRGIQRPLQPRARTSHPRASRRPIISSKPRRAGPTGSWLPLGLAQSPALVLVSAPSALRLLGVGAPMAPECWCR